MGLSPPVSASRCPRPVRAASRTPDTSRRSRGARARKAALASRVVASIPIVLPFTRSAVASTCRIHVARPPGASRGRSAPRPGDVECRVSSGPTRESRAAPASRQSARRSHAPNRPSSPIKSAGNRSPGATGTADLGVERGALRLDERVERVRVQDLPLIERMPARRQRVRRDPQSAVPGPYVDSWPCGSERGISVSPFRPFRLLGAESPEPEVWSL